MKRILAIISLLPFSACATMPAAPPQRPAQAAAATALPAGVSMSEATWYSEQVHVAGRLFAPSGPVATARPGVVLAPAAETTAETLDAYAIALARQGIVALAI